eukprot:gb/GECG01015815.1/.p1 GENE.gb/GECG01015815.1/~~gb/GECG01015815.1/.p1  ORF type:complete len:437 (+),score=65.79 gb/GECG01015815.1/:1-1311(+)
MSSEAPGAAQGGDSMASKKGSVTRSSTVSVSASRASEYYTETGKSTHRLSLPVGGAYYSRLGKVPPPAPPRPEEDYAPISKPDFSSAHAASSGPTEKTRRNTTDVSIATSRLKMLRILEDHEQTQEFLRQARDQHSAENVELWLGIRDCFVKKYKAPKGFKDTEFLENAESLYREFIRNGAKKQVNMRDVTRNELKDAIDGGDTEKVRQIFEGLQETTLQQMILDLLPRFSAPSHKNHDVKSTIPEADTETGTGTGKSQQASARSEERDDGSSTGTEDTSNGATPVADDDCKLTRTQACDLADQLFTKSKMVGINRRRKLKGGDVVAAKRLSGWVYANKRMSGFLMKRGDQVPSWKRRYFVLAPPLLVYYEREKENIPRGVIRLNDSFSVSTYGEKEYGSLPFFFMIRTPWRCYLFQADTASDHQRWVEKLEAEAQ